MSFSKNRVTWSFGPEKKNLVQPSPNLLLLCHLHHITWYAGSLDNVLLLKHSHLVTWKEEQMFESTEHIPGAHSLLKV